jgi:hypothetical protein
VPSISSAQESFRTYPMVFLGDEAIAEAQFGLFGGTSNLDARQENSLPKRTIGSYIFLAAPDGTPR